MKNNDNVHPYSAINSYTELFTSGYVLRKQGKIAEATERFKAAQEGLESIPEFQLKIDYEMGANQVVEMRAGSTV